jgi:hypothetical protein
MRPESSELNELPVTASIGSNPDGYRTGQRTVYVCRCRDCGRLIEGSVGVEVPLVAGDVPSWRGRDIRAERVWLPDRTGIWTA